MSKETSEIAKLTERIAKDPKSKLFVPLAEEYKKAGDIEMSIHVLTEGLKNNPGYITARSFLGRLLLDKGDFPGAQKEFEEVVRAIPDNLMAQRKLADLYAFQDRPADALNHYKIALSLNPKDEETAMLIAEAEAGRDIKQHLHLPQPKSPVPQAEPQKPEQSKRPAAGVPKAAPQPHSSKPASEAASASAEHEEPEEVLVVEPLEEPGPAGISGQPAVDSMDFLTDSAPESGFEPEQEAGDGTFSLDAPFPQTGELSGGQVLDPEDPFGLGIAEPAPETGQAGEPEKQADDFTTDTLAELYIAQGFFEKAVEIYERMLADRPDSRGLKDKLSKVRAMAAEAGAADESSAAQADETIPEETVADFATGAAGPGSSESNAFMQTGPDSGEARLDEFELPAAADPFDEPVPAPEPRRIPQPQHFDVGFEPREYIPLDAVPRASQGEVEPPAAFRQEKQADRSQEREVRAARKPEPSRKETVERLEGWLKNIMKEK